MSQRELARRAGIPQASLSRIERGVVSPSVETLERLFRQCGLEVDAVARPGEGVDRTLIRERLALTPGNRVAEAESEWTGAEAFRKAVRRGR